MKEQFVTYEIALKLKELGFDEPCFAHFLYKDNITYKRAIQLKSDKMLYYCQQNINPYNQYKEMCTAPLWQQVFDWLEEKFQLNIQIEYNETQKWWRYDIFDYSKKIDWTTEFEIETKLKAKEKSILKAIELCEKKNI